MRRNEDIPLEIQVIAERQAAWATASSLVQPIIDDYDLEEYKSSGSVFGPVTTFTKVDQHLDHIMRVADWLLYKEGL